MTNDEMQIRAAAEELLGSSINSQRSSCTQHSIARTPDIVLSEDLIAGMTQNGRISNVRRFFCLFVTFDLLLIFLMWLICTMIAGESLKTAFIEQVVHYHIKTSLFDIVMAAVCRFTVLLLFYAMLHLNHWIIVAISTATTSAFLITKVFLFDWTICSQPVFQVLLIISSFVLAWAEAWFFDFRVIPQETQARNWFRVHTDAERAPLLHAVTSESRQYSSVEPGNFFTPMDSPDLSDNEELFAKKPQVGQRRLSRTSGISSSASLPPLTPDRVEEYKAKATTLLKECYDLLTSWDWQIESTRSDGDVVLYMERPKPQGKIFRIIGTVDCPANVLVNQLFDGVETSTTWNKLVSESKKLQQIDENTDIVYQTTCPRGGGIIGARDFVILRHRNRCGKFYISSGISVPLASLPIPKNVIRGENGISCWAAEELPDDEGKCRFTWILNTNLKGWLPQNIVEKSMTHALIDFMSYLRKHVDKTQNGHKTFA